MTLPKIPSVKDDNFCDTVEFLTACQEIIGLTSKLGKVFASIKYDMQKSLDVLTKLYYNEPEKYSNLFKIVMTDGNDHRTKCVNTSYIWLRRNLQLIHNFFKRIIKMHKSGNLGDDLSISLRNAYKDSLEMDHNWIAQQLFGILSRGGLTRTQFFQALSNGTTVYEEPVIIEQMTNFQKKLLTLLFYMDNNLPENTPFIPEP